MMETKREKDNPGPGPSYRFKVNTGLVITVVRGVVTIQIKCLVH